MVGYFFTAKKPVERRWASRSALWVSMLAASTSASTLELAGCCASRERRPRIALKRPLVVVTDMTWIENETCEWTGSISQIIVILLEKLFREKGFLLRVYGSMYEERGSRGLICDRRIWLSQK